MSTQTPLPPLDRIQGLPLELRESIYSSVLDDITAEPQHPYSDLPSNSRFRTYVSLLLVNRAMSREVKRVFTKKYTEKIVFYFEDAYSLVELMRRSETIPFLRDVQFVLRTRTDLEPEPVIHDAILEMNEDFMSMIAHNHSQKLRTRNIIRPSRVARPRFNLDWWLSSPDSPARNYQVTASDHTLCDQHTKEQCIDYESIKIPDMFGSLRADLAIWKRPLQGVLPQVTSDQITPLPSEMWGDMSQNTEDRHTGMKRVAVLLFRGKLRDVFVEDLWQHAELRYMKMQLMAFLLVCPWPKVRELYRGKYPLNDQEWQDFWVGKTKSPSFYPAMAEYYLEDYRTFAKNIRYKGFYIKEKEIPSLTHK